MEQRTFARHLRNTATDAERALWKAISARKVASVRFNRQVPIGPFICDFASRSAKPIIEVDGGQHGVHTDRDANRTSYLRENGFTVLRFWNNDVLTNLAGVVAEIERVLADMPSPDPSRSAGGEI